MIKLNCYRQTPVRHRSNISSKVVNAVKDAAKPAENESQLSVRKPVFDINYYELLEGISRIRHTQNSKFRFVPESILENSIL